MHKSALARVLRLPDVHDVGEGGHLCHRFEHAAPNPRYALPCPRAASGGGLGPLSRIGAGVKLREECLWVESEHTDISRWP